MGAIAAGFAAAFADGADVSKRQVRVLGATIEDIISGAVAGISSYATVALMEAVTPANGDLAYVYDNAGSPSDAANKFYQGEGGNWVEAPWIMGEVTLPSVIVADALDNVALGAGAGDSITSGGDNTLVGRNAGSAITTGARNTIIGQSAGLSQTTATDNVLIGDIAGRDITTGVANVLIGSEAGFQATTATLNTGVGGSNLRSLTNGVNNSVLGNQACYSLTTGDNNTAIGAQALYTCATGDNNTALGYQALSLTTGSENTAVGNQALVSTTSGQYNSALGERAGDSNSTGSYNTALGGETLYAKRTGDNNTAVGGKAMRGVEQTITITGASGDGATVTFTFASIGTAVQTGTSVRVTGADPSGYNGEFLVTGGTATTMTVADAEVAAWVSGGSIEVFYDVAGNTAVGFEALYNPDKGADDNTAIGRRAGYAVTTGASNTLLGREAGDALTTGSNNIVIGAGKDADSATASDQINIGDRYFHDRIRLLERSSDPAEPTEGNAVIWLSDGSGKGDDGDVLIAVKAGGVTTWGTLFDKSAGNAW